MKKMLKLFGAALLTMVMVMAFVPQSVFAEGEAEGFLGAVQIGGNPGYALTPEFSSDVMEYSFDMQDTATSCSVKPTLSEAGAGGTIKVFWINQNNGTEQNATLTNNGSRNLVGFRKADMGSGCEFTIEVTKDEEVQTYVFRNRVISTMKSLSAKAGDTALRIDPAVAPATKEYSSTVLNTVDSITVTAGGYQDSYTVAINGAAAEGGKADVALTQDQNVIPIVVQGLNMEPNEYTLTVNRVAPAKVTFDVTPEEACVYMVDRYKDRVWPNDEDEFELQSGQDYTYFVTLDGYVAQSDTINLTEDQTKTIKLEKAAENEGIDKTIPAQWKNFRGSDSNMAIVDHPTPKSAKATEFHWAKKLGTGWSASPTPQLIIDGKLIVIAGTTIYSMDPITGETLASGVLSAAPNYSYTPMTYVDGMILCPLAGGTVQAVNAKTLESLWIYKDAKGGQALSPITVSNGYGYTGFWNSETADANYACFSLTDEDPQSPNEAKKPSWTYSSPGGFYWAGSFAAGDYILIGTDDGTNNADGPASLLALDAETGEVADSAAIKGDQRSTIAYDAVTDRYYATTKAGELFSFAFDQEEGEIKDLKSVSYEGMSTSTPVVYKGVVYWGHSSGSNFSGKYEMVASDAETLQPKWTAELKGYPQCSMLLSTAYEEEEGYIYLYSTYNNNPGGITLVKAKPDATGTGEDDVITEEIYDAEGYAQYCISSIISDENGNLYYKNDSGNVISVGAVKASLETLATEDGHPAWDKEFIGSKENYNLVVDAGTPKVSFTFEPSEGCSVEVNGREVQDRTCDVALKNGEGQLVISAVSGANKKTYTVDIRTRSQEASLANLMVNEANSYGSPKAMSPAFVPEGKDFTVYKAGSSRTFENIWPDAADPNAAVKVFVVSGVKSNGVDPDTKELKVTATNSGHNRYAAYFDGNTMKLRIEVTSESGDNTREYFLTITKNSTADTEEAQAYCDSIDPSNYLGDEKAAVQAAKTTLQEAIASGDAASITAALTAAMEAVNGSTTIQETIDQLNQEIERAKTEIAAAEAANASAGKTIEEAQQRIDEAQARLEEAQASISDLEEALEAEKAARAEAEQTLKEQLEQAQKDLEEALRKAEEAIARAEALEQKNQEAEAAKAAYKENVKAAKALEVKGLKVKAVKGKKAVATWKAATTGSGYVIQYSNARNFKKAKTMTVKNLATKKGTIKKLKAKKAYYVRICTYTEVQNPMTDKVEKVQGKWSAARKVKIKK